VCERMFVIDFVCVMCVFVSECVFVAFVRVCVCVCAFVCAYVGFVFMYVFCVGIYLCV